MVRTKHASHEKKIKAPSFTLTDLNLPFGPLPGRSLAINGYGQIVGTMGGAGSQQAFLWQPSKKNSLTGSLYNLPSPSGTSFAMDINRNGEVIGYVSACNGMMAQAIWKPNKNNSPPSQNNPMTPILINSNSTKSVAPQNCNYGGINDRGWVASTESDLPNSQVRATVFTGTSLIELDGNMLSGRAINNNIKCQIVGHIMTPSPNFSQPVRWFPNLSSIGSPGTYKTFLDFVHVPQYAKARDGAAWDVNDHGDVVAGFNVPLAIHPVALFSHVVIWKNNDSVVDFTQSLVNLLGAQSAQLEKQAYGINNRGDVVGTVDTSLAFLFVGNVAYDLNKYVGNLGTNRLGIAADINDQGQIVATGANGNVPAGYLLTPTKTRAGRR